MLFNSLLFLFFLPTTFCLYWFVFNKKLSHQNLFLVAASYFFYACWDIRFLGLIILSTLIDFFVGNKIFNSKNNKRKTFLFLSIFSNITILAFFKYFNFFIESFDDLINMIGYELQNKFLINIILPVGISFYTFQTMSYTIDIYNNKIKPTNNLISFAAFVSFFPQLVAGPIERASNLLPQMLRERKFHFEKAFEGIILIIWGFFKKIVIADSLSPIVNEIFDNYSELGGFTLLLGIFYFSFQIYCDFSGYSDIAIGTAKIFGIDLMTNFKFPYFSKSIPEFWKRWHISLSTWFRDYIYIPLGGSLGSTNKTIRNIFIIFVLSGFWHGANWTFIFWGLIHALFYIPFYLTKKYKIIVFPFLQKNTDNALFNNIKIVFTFIVVMTAWIFFRSDSLKMSFKIINEILFNPTFTNILNPYNNLEGLYYLIYVVIFIVMDRFMMKTDHLMNFSYFKKTIIISVLSFITIFLIQLEVNDVFIYFQF